MPPINDITRSCIGQFWNVPVSIGPFTGENIYGDPVENTYILNITTPTDKRSYTGILSLLTWDLEEGPCLYVGDSQSSSIYEISHPNDAVIEGIYSDYKVTDAFMEDFAFGQFDGEMCSNVVVN